jgi:hypothetical protein
MVVKLSKPSAKKVIGLVELVSVGGKRLVKTKALFDTGATRTSVDVRIAARAKIGPIVSSIKVKNAGAPYGYFRRAVAKATIIVRGVKIRTGVSIEDREDMPYPVLIGRDILHNNFLIDVSKSHSTNKVRDVKRKKLAMDGRRTKVL